MCLSVSKHNEHTLRSLAMHQRVICVGVSTGRRAEVFVGIWLYEEEWCPHWETFELGRQQHWWSDWWLVQRSFIILCAGRQVMTEWGVEWRMDWGRSFSGAHDEMRMSTDSSRDQAECNHYGHVLLESQLTVICVSGGLADDNGPMITEHSSML